MSATPEQILQYISRHGPAGAPELSRALGLTIQDVRYHLNKMVSDGWIEYLPSLNPHRRGRPVRRYQLSSKSSVNGLSALLESFLSEMFTVMGEVEIEALLRRISRKLAGVPPAHPWPQTQRNNWALQRLSQLCFQARWEAHPDGAHIFIGFSPLARYAVDFPLVSILEKYLLEDLLSRPLAPIQTKHVSGTERVFLLL